LQQVVSRPSDKTSKIPVTYNDFVDSSPQGMLYDYTWWLDAVAPGQYSILEVRDGDQLRAAWPITFQEVGGQRIIGMPPMTQKLGVLLPPSAARYPEKLSQEHRLIEGLIEQLPPDVFVAHHFHENFTNWLPFYWRNFQQTTRYTYVLPDIRDLDAVWNGFRKTARNTVRNAEKQGLRVRDAGDVAEIFRLYSLTMERQGLAAAYSLEQLQRVDAACATHAGRLALIADDAQGTPHAAVYVVYYKDCAVYLMGGADPSFRQSGAQTLLLWEAIRRTSVQCSRFDFEGSMLRGVEAALRDFGAVQTPYFRIWRDPTARADAQPAVSMVRRQAARFFRKVARLADPSMLATGKV